MGRVQQINHEFMILIVIRMVFYSWFVRKLIVPTPRTHTQYYQLAVSPSIFSSAQLRCAARSIQAKIIDSMQVRIVWISSEL